MIKNNLIDLYREYVRVADMCNEYNDGHKTSIQPRECVRLKSATGEWVGYFSMNEPNFTELLRHKVRFAVAILAGKPIFIGETVYSPEGERYRVDGSQLTFTLNGVELPCPEKEPGYENKVVIHISGSRMPPFPELRLYFKAGSAYDFYNRLRNILRDARDKE